MLLEPIPEDERCILDLVKFEDVLISYSKKYHIYVNFILDNELKGSTLDWIGIFKAGWDKYESFLAFEWGIGEPVDDTGRKRRLIFDHKYLKTAELDTYYQFVYISKNLQILGVSQFFQFIDDEEQNESFCLNASFLSTGNIYNSTEYQINREEHIEHVKDSMSPVKRARPSCSINLPNNWEQVYTSCWRCKSLFEMRDKHNELIAKLKECTEQNEQLKERLTKLELAIENIWMTKTVVDPWDENRDELKFQHFISSLIGTPLRNTEGYEKGDHWCEKNQIIPVADDNVTSSTYDYFSVDASSREILLKAIIGSQEDKIRDLTRTIRQMQRLMIQDIPKTMINKGIVTLVKAKEKIIPEIIELSNSDSDDKKDENDNHTKIVQVEESVALKQ